MSSVTKKALGERTEMAEKEKQRRREAVMLCWGCDFRVEGRSGF